jgi:hypothetical protein
MRLHRGKGGRRGGVAGSRGRAARAQAEAEAMALSPSGQLLVTGGKDQARSR